MLDVGLGASFSKAISFPERLLSIGFIKYHQEESNFGTKQL